MEESEEKKIVMKRSEVEKEERNERVERDLYKKKDPSRLDHSLDRTQEDGKVV